MSTDYIAAFYGVHVNNNEKFMGKWEKYGIGDANIFKNICDSIEHHIYRSPLDKNTALKAETYLTWEFVGTFKKDKILRVLEDSDFSIKSMKDVDEKFENRDSLEPFAIFKDGVLYETTDLPFDFNPMIEFEVEIVTTDNYEKDKEKYPNKTFIKFEDWVGGLNKSPDFINLYVKKVNYRNGKYYDYSDFEKIKEKLKLNYIEKLKRLFKLENNLDSIDYFRLDQEQKEDFQYTINDLKEDINDLEYSILACDHFLSLIDFYSDIYEDDELSWSPKHIVVYIYRT